MKVACLGAQGCRRELCPLPPFRGSWTTSPSGVPSPSPCASRGRPAAAPGRRAANRPRAARRGTNLLGGEPAIWMMGPPGQGAVGAMTSALISPQDHGQPCQPRRGSPSSGPGDGGLPGEDVVRAGGALETGGGDGVPPPAIPAPAPDLIPAHPPPPEVAR